ncbi:Gfo/Idh/MocA family protein [Streptomyces scopuliridis]
MPSTRPPGNRSPIRAAVVGTGQIADGAHMPALHQLAAQVRVVAAVDTDPARLQSFADRWGIDGRYATCASMLAVEQPELVVLCTPPAVHTSDAIEALQSGAWVWCEKPPALSLAEYDAISAAERPGGPYAPVVFQQRYGSGARHAHNLFDSGLLGRPLVAHCQTTWYREPEYFVPEWRGSFSGDGGPVMALGIHQIDLLIHLLGPWREVQAFSASTSRAIETGDVHTALVRFDSGALATVVTSAVSPREVSHLRVDTELATVELTHLYRHGNADWVYTPAPGVPGEAVSQWSNPLPDETSGHPPQLRALLDDLRAGRRPATSGASGRAALELITAMQRSAATGESVKRGAIGPDDPFYHHLSGSIPDKSVEVADDH